MNQQVYDRTHFENDTYQVSHRPDMVIPFRLEPPGNHVNQTAIFKSSFALIMKNLLALAVCWSPVPKATFCPT
ncbi:MAG: hypothetical protein JRN20_13645 [Nitrososphaerota archaeon]|jgi:hypothetical protein|nr:hypothetical protein [Nitrososphaerota archaeon]